MEGWLNISKPNNVTHYINNNRKKYDSSLWIIKATYMLPDNFQKTASIPF